MFLVSQKSSSFVSLGFIFFYQIKTERDSTSAEDNILHFLQACNGLGVVKVSLLIHFYFITSLPPSLPIPSSLPSCTSLSSSYQIFRLGDLTDSKRDFAPVLATLQELYRIAEGQFVIFYRINYKILSVSYIISC